MLIRLRGRDPQGSGVLVLTWMRVGVFTIDDGMTLRDGAFETDLLIHEYAHGVSTRLVDGDPACLNGTQPRALAEGSGVG